MRYNEDQLSHVNDDHVVNVVVMGVFASPRVYVLSTYILILYSFPLLLIQVKS